jgi:hypothetical protein
MPDEYRLRLNKVAKILKPEIDYPDPWAYPGCRLGINRRS